MRAMLWAGPADLMSLIRTDEMGRGAFKACRERARFKNGAETFVVLYFIVRTARFFILLLHPALRVSKHSLDGPAGTPSPKTGPLILCNLLN